MSYYWAMAGQWMASTLRSTAEAHLARAAAIRTGAQSIGALRPPVWTGRAAQTERADREAMTARMDRTTQVLEGYGRLARDTASELAAIQADRAAIVSELNALGWLMNAFGVLSRLSPTSSTGAIEAAWSLTSPGAPSSSTEVPPRRWTRWRPPISGIRSGSRRLTPSTPTS